MQKVIGHTGKIVWNDSMPDGFPEKTLDVSRVREMGWQAKTALDQGIAETHAWYVANIGKGLVRCGSR
jgi:GDP-L-fucose synthase